MRAIGIILAGGNNNRMRELSDKRAIAAMPIAGSYRSIDFALSNMANSRIQKVAVLTQYNARSLNEHLSSSKWWDFGRKQGGLFVFTPTITKENGFWYQGTADAIYQNLNFLKNSHEPYVVIASGDCVYKMDYNKVLEYHIAKRADITVVCTTCPDPSEVERFGVLRMNEDCRIEEFEEKPMVSPYNTISTGIYVIRRRQLIELIEKAAQEGRNDFVKDILIRYKNLKRIYGYKIDSYWSNISTVESYYKTNMDFLKPEIRNYFFKQEPAVKTKIDDLPPAKYNPGAKGDSVKSWKSTNTKIFTVKGKENGTCKLTAKKSGTAKLQITLASGLKKTVTVKVRKTAVKTTKVTVANTKVTVQKGKKVALKPVVKPFTSKQKVTYTSSNKKVATVSSKGIVTGKKKGTTKITVKSGSKSVKVTVKVK